MAEPQSVAAQLDVRDYIEGIGAVLAGTANVIMQLSWPAVGYGVMESTVESGRIFDHPLKRGRTTLSFLAVAIMGDDADRVAYRKAINSAHVHVHSTPESPVAYNAFDPELQLWVAACLSYGARDSLRKMRGPLDRAEDDALYRETARFGTTLQGHERAVACRSGGVRGVLGRRLGQDRHRRHHPRLPALSARQQTVPVVPTSSTPGV